MATNNTTHEQENDLRPEKGIFWPAMIGVLLIALPMLFFPKASEEIIGAIYTPFSIKFGSLYLWITVGLIILCVYFACSRYGDIKFGDPGEKPQYSLPSWVAMIFCSGVAGAVMFWSIVEPLWDLITPPQYAEPMSTEAFDWALTYMLLHWGPNAWCTYFITALPIAYLFHIRRLLADALVLVLKHLVSLGGKLIVFPVEFRPGEQDQTILFKSLQQGVQGAGSHVHPAIGEGGDGLHDAVAVALLPQDQQHIEHLLCQRLQLLACQW